ncbi:phosphatidylserine/phosphatidylglycerophosphate/cardiolipin synthase family protein [Halobacteriovorax sp. HLS]|uniref:phospholipase D-like domain-containing protein n=1 Tax=Halobacteriovorax sp. HLS TaxID=2234000 RepID=UPI000FD7AA8E|nr:phospholipase D-like domain-containing protein [Halobacteriovorax sp. HLS]
MIKKIFKFFAIFFLSCLGGIYLSFVGFYKWEELQIENNEAIHKSISSHSTMSHRIIPLNEGPLSLAKRLEIIESAKNSIELEFFIYDLDFASQLITKALIKKAQEGVRVRMLIDFSLPVFKLKPIYASFLKERGVEVKYYNTSELYKIFSVQHRSHRKLLIVDDIKVITGGRNISNDYFNLSQNYNFLDSDIYLEGEISKSIRESFDVYWNSKLAEDSGLTSKVTNEELQKAKAFINISETDKALDENVNILKKDILKNEESFACNDITFVTDLPGVSLENRRVYKTLEVLLQKTEARVFAESPYFVLRKDGLDLLQKMDSRNINLTVLTNGLYSTDAYYTISALYNVLDDLENTKINLFSYNGKRPAIKYELPVENSTRWGTHSKRAIIDSDTFVIGTYNIDPRSANLNSELIIVCKGNVELVEHTMSDMSARVKNSLPIVQNEELFLDNLLVGSTFKQRVKFYTAIPFARLFDFLL